MNPTPPKMLTSNITVTMPAPALSPVVAGRMVAGSELACGDVPALGSPSLVPPVVLVSSGEAELSSMHWMTERADICWPTPGLPS